MLRLVLYVLAVLTANTLYLQLRELCSFVVKVRDPDVMRHSAYLQFHEMLFAGLIFGVFWGALFFGGRVYRERLHTLERRVFLGLAGSVVLLTALATVGMMVEHLTRP